MNSKANAALNTIFVLLLGFKLGELSVRRNLLAKTPTVRWGGRAASTPNEWLERGWSGREVIWNAQATLCTYGGGWVRAGVRRTHELVRCNFGCMVLKLCCATSMISSNPFLITSQNKLSKVWPHLWKVVPRWSAAFQKANNYLEVWSQTRPHCHRSWHSMPRKRNLKRLKKIFPQKCARRLKQWRRTSCQNAVNRQQRAWELKPLTCFFIGSNVSSLSSFVSKHWGWPIGNNINPTMYTCWDRVMKTPSSICKVEIKRLTNARIFKCEGRCMTWKFTHAHWWCTSACVLVCDTLSGHCR